MNQVRYEVSRRYRSKIEKVYVGKTEKFTEQELKDKIKEKWDKILVAKFVSPYVLGKRDFHWLILRMEAILTIFAVEAVVSKFEVNVWHCIL